VKRIGALLSLGLLALIAWQAFEWTVNRVYVPEGRSLQLQYKGPFFGSLFGEPQYASPGFWAEEGEIGVRKELRGPGRHFYCPIWWNRVLVDDVLIAPGQVGIVTCKLGKDLPEGQFLVDGDIGGTEFKGILRKALTPGRYRINPYGYEIKIVDTVTEPSGVQIKHSGWVDIPAGFVGVVTNLADDPATGEKQGVQSTVLQPGIYPINGREQQVDIVGIGYWETTLGVEKSRKSDGTLNLDSSGEPVVQDGEMGINFPSSDGFNIQMDFTAIWGLTPEQAPHAVSAFGNISAVENKVILPQTESICRNNGSRYTAVQLLVGEDREKFQQQIVQEFQKVLAEKQVTLQYGLVRHIYIPREVREPIQMAFVADELKLTREQEQLTARMEALLGEAEQSVELEKERVLVDTDRMFQSAVAEGDRQAKQMDAQTARQVAQIERQTAELKAEAATVLAEAESKGQQMIEEAKAEKFGLAVKAFGNPNAFNDWTFASSLPDDMELKFLYAGPGTLWTDSEDLGLRAMIPVDQNSPTTPGAPEKKK
jgi:regulator of protease activity HflC (stomatin/prohibitin superfamily)